MKKVALFFGSFNPIHHGHITIAKCMLQRGYADEVWFVVSPQNPMKRGANADEEQRATLIEQELSSQLLSNQIKVSRVEFNMPTPSYTVNTLRKLHVDFSDVDFSLIIGEDNLRAFHKWKDYKDITKMMKIYVYPRKGNNYEGILDVEIDEDLLKNIIYIPDVSLLDVSSTAIRKFKKHFNEGIEFQQKGELHNALNSFVLAQELTSNNKELNTRIEMIKEIFNYSYKEYLNT